MTARLAVRQWLCTKVVVYSKPVTALLQLRIESFTPQVVRWHAEHLSTVDDLIILEPPRQGDSARS